MDTRFERVLNQTKGFRLNFSEKDRLDVNDGEEGEFRINKSNGINNLYVKINKKWKSIQLLDPQTNIQGNVEQSDSYENLGMPPCNYDSGWISVSNGTDVYTLAHNLGSEIIATQAYIKDTSNSNRIFSLNTSFVDTVFQTDDIGIWFYHKTPNIIEVCTGNDFIFMYDNTSHSSSAVKITSGDVRLLAWKIQGI